MTTHPVLGYLMGLRSAPPTPEAVERWWEQMLAPAPAPAPRDPRGMCQRPTN